MIGQDDTMIQWQSWQLLPLSRTLQGVVTFLSELVDIAYTQPSLCHYALLIRLQNIALYKHISTDWSIY